MKEALVIGAGPAGLMAADCLALAGLTVTVAEAKSSVGRKFLMAGKSGLNLTKDEPKAQFMAQYDTPWLAPMLEAFGPAEVQDWARSLDQDVFTGTSGRVFPVAMKGSPLLRAWIARLTGLGVQVRTRWRWLGWEENADLVFETEMGRVTRSPAVTVLALGGASWARLGADGAWAKILAARGVGLAPFKPANMGFELPWSAHMARHFGQAVKGAALLVAGQRARGEFIISERGIEGGGVYAISRALREGGALHLDLMPDVQADTVQTRLGRMKPGESAMNRLRKLGLSPVAQALVMEFGRGMDLTQAVKHLPIPLAGPRPMDEAISVAGGITRESLTESLELRAIPGVFACGEMLDWEAPTGGYLLTGCLATGRWAGQAAALAATV